MKISTIYVVKDLPKMVKHSNMVCKECVMEKQKKSSFPNKMFTTSTKLEIVHTDLSGLTRTRVFNGERYFILLIDDFTKMMWEVFLREKS